MSNTSYVIIIALGSAILIVGPIVIVIFIRKIRHIESTKRDVPTHSSQPHREQVEEDPHPSPSPSRRSLAIRRLTNLNWSEDQHSPRRTTFWAEEHPAPHRGPLYPLYPMFSERSLVRRPSDMISPGHDEISYLPEHEASSHPMPPTCVLPGTPEPLRGTWMTEGEEPDEPLPIVPEGDRPLPSYLLPTTPELFIITSSLELA